MLDNSPISCGSFRLNGSNCSTFVNTVILAGRPEMKYRIGLKHKVPLTPASKSNVNGAGSLFVFMLEGTLLKVTRYSPQGMIECKGLYEKSDAKEVN